MKNKNNKLTSKKINLIKKRVKFKKYKNNLINKILINCK